MTRLAICITSFNRRETTKRCLEKIFTSSFPTDLTAQVFLLDDGSSDGTSEMVAECYPTVRLHQGDGNYYWAGGMRRVFGLALQEDFDYYLWLNDDVDLFPDSIARAVSASLSLTHKGDDLHLIVGAMRDSNGNTTYSGYERAQSILPWRFRRIDPHETSLRRCATVNGNFLLVNRSLSKLIGNIRPQFVQMHADFDYGLRANSRGGSCWVLPGYAGICESNVSGRKNFKDPTLPLSERIALMEHPLGYPLRSNLAYSRNFGIWGLAAVVAPYAAVLMPRLPFFLANFRRKQERWLGDR